MILSFHLYDEKQEERNYNKTTIGKIKIGGFYEN